MDWIGNDTRAKVWVYNIGADKSWIPKKAGVHKVNNHLEQKILNRQAELTLFLAKELDTVFLTKKPDEEFISDMRIFGISRPKINLLPEDLSINFSQFLAESEVFQAELLKERKEDTIYVPYIVSEQDEKICAELGLHLWGGAASTAKRVNSKIIYRQISQELGLPTTEGFMCSSLQELVDKYEQLIKKGYKHCVLKEPFGNSGKGVHFIKDERIFKNMLRLISFPEEQGSFQVLLEGWIEDKTDLNYQIEISPKGDVKLLIINEQIINQTAYKGTRFPARISKEQMDFINEATQAVGKRLYQEGYIGIMGVDAIVKKNGDIIPVLELNGRFNQSSFYIPIFLRLNEWKRQVIIKFYDIRTTEPLNYCSLKNHLDLHGKAFNENDRTGVCIVNSGCLSFDFDEEDKMYLSRVFVAIIAEEDKNMDEEISATDSLIALIQNNKRER